MNRQFPRGVVCKNYPTGLWLGMIRHSAIRRDHTRWLLFMTWPEALAYVNETLKSLHDKEPER